MILMDSKKTVKDTEAEGLKMKREGRRRVCDKRGEHIMEKFMRGDRKGKKKMELKGVAYSTSINH